jgi:hypothetical protein
VGLADHGRARRADQVRTGGREIILFGPTIQSGECSRPRWFSNQWAALSPDGPVMPNQAWSAICLIRTAGPESGGQSTRHTYHWARPVWTGYAWTALAARLVVTLDGPIGQVRPAEVAHLPVGQAEPGSSQQPTLIQPGPFRVRVCPAGPF